MRSVLGLLFLATCVLASDVSGIWVGQQQGRRGEPEDLAFRFALNGQTLTGKMFGDEADLPISEGSFSDDQVRFVITQTNYYNGTKTRFVYTGTIKENVMELTRERIQTDADKKNAEKNPAAAANRFGPAQQKLTLKRIK